MEPLVRFDLRHGVAHVTVSHPMASTLGLPAMRELRRARASRGTRPDPPAAACEPGGRPGRARPSRGGDNLVGRGHTRGPGAHLGVPRPVGPPLTQPRSGVEEQDHGLRHARGLVLTLDLDGVARDELASGSDGR